MKNPAFEVQRQEFVNRLKADTALHDRSMQWVADSSAHGYSYNFNWMGRPIIQYPQDMIAMQEIIWDTQADLIIETGVAHGGSIIYYASLMQMIGGSGHVIGIDVEVREHNRKALEVHPMRDRYSIIEGSSVDPAVVDQVRKMAEGRDRILVCLDSNHSHEHVLAELRAYSPFVRNGGYLVVFDTVIEYFPKGSFPDRPWDKGSNALTAVQAFLQENDRFVVDTDMDAKLMISVCPHGYLKCVKD